MHGMDFRLAGGEQLHGSGGSVEYDEACASVYATHYLQPWPLKHRINALVLNDLLGRPFGRDPVWLDTCCGLAWHFSRFPNPLQKIGVDHRAAQLRRARLQNPDAAFACASMVGPISRYFFRRVLRLSMNPGFPVLQDRIEDDKGNGGIKF